MLALIVSTGCSSDDAPPECNSEQKKLVADVLNDAAAEAINCTLANPAAYQACVDSADAHARQRIQPLPKSCQHIYDELKDAPTGNSSGTMCVSDVCCDSTGCYG